MYIESIWSEKSAHNGASNSILNIVISLRVSGRKQCRILSFLFSPNQYFNLDGKAFITMSLSDFCCSATSKTEVSLENLKN